MLERADYHPVVGVTNNDLRKEEALLESMMSWRPAAAILANLTHTDRTTRILRAASIPVVEIMDINGVPIDMSVGFNHIHAAQELADYLIGRGYRRFGYVGWIRNEFAASARYAALRARLERLGYGLVAPDLFKMPPDVPGGKYGTSCSWSRPQTQMSSSTPMIWRQWEERSIVSKAEYRFPASSQSQVSQDLEWAKVFLGH